MRILLIGGTGNISSFVTSAALERGHEVTVLNRGRSPLPEGVRSLIGDAGDPASLQEAIGAETFDAVANFRAFSPQQAADDIRIFSGRTRQYLYISSASAYQKPIAQLPITEATPLHNPFWQYSRDKIASEELLMAAYRDAGFPVTIVRPSHTYGPSLIPLEGGWTTLQRIIDGRPIIVHGDGTSWWTLTHSRDFAEAFVGLLGNPHAEGQAVHITSDESLTWDRIAQLLGRALGAEPQIVHATSEQIDQELPSIGPGLLGDKAHSVLFDNSLIKRLVPGWRATTPFAQGAQEIVDWYRAEESRRSIDPELDRGLDRLVERYGR